MNSKTVRTHSKGDPFTREVPFGCLSKSQWAKAGQVPIPNARPAAWILMGDNLHEYAVFAPNQVMPGKPEQVKRITARQLERAFERLKPLLTPDRHYDLVIATDQHYYVIDWWYYNEEGNMVSGSINLSGGDRGMGTMRQALASLERLIERKSPQATAQTSSKEEFNGNR